MADDDNEVISKTTSAETALDIAAFIGSAVPWIGGPVSNVLGGMSQSRKLARIHQVLSQLAAGLGAFKSDASENYVNTEDFEDILEQALKRASEEKAELKRKIYGKFLLEAIRSPGESYDEQLRFLRVLEEVQVAHLSVIKALSKAPGDYKSSITGSPSQTLSRRLPEMTQAQIGDLVSQLNDMRLTNLTSLNVTMTPRGAEDLRHSVTSFGARFLTFLSNT